MTMLVTLARTVSLVILAFFLAGCAHTYSVRIGQGQDGSLPTGEVRNALDTWVGSRGFQRVQAPKWWVKAQEEDDRVHVALWRNPGRRSFWYGQTSVDVSEVKAQTEIILYVDGDAHFTRPVAEDLAKQLEESLPGYAVKVRVHVMYGWSWGP
jgi:hypothetical protein